MEFIFLLNSSTPYWPINKGNKHIEEDLQYILSKKIYFVLAELDIFGGSRLNIAGLLLFM